ncbi:innexin inx7 [Tribolium castaneum]|uniref:Innexin n=1 Tax=Tribolium castaneum TaxID=7070 RepID=A0A139WAT1_TRICA|nr:PREDICTED: innexin inx7-like [Tribolium castaneum]KYB25015.1 Innexin inx7-like Protein [Tribolium castaneum]|eukprot:XP_008198821.1 PREDICTED: innexin inx7-like [Tribolium castaneum]
MLVLFKEISNRIKPKLGSPCIDNWVFKLHYRATTVIFFVATILVTSREYIGEHIKCVSDSVNNKEFHKVIESFCFFSTTFTVIRDEFNFGFGDPPHPGVFPYGLLSKPPIRKHLYYQWVPFVLFGQGVMFMLTHFLWKSWEMGRVRKLVSGLTYSSLAFLENSVMVDGKSIPSKKEKEITIRRIKDSFFENVKINRAWAPQLILCEILNFANVGLQAYITNKFLGGHFYTLGIKIFTQGHSILDDVFPKVTKCTFHKYGPSGTVQLHDALCIMALNIINEKIYIFLWFWFIFLLVLSGLVLVWRFASILLYSKSPVFGRIIFGFGAKKLSFWKLKTVTRKFTYADWLFLKYLSKNLDGLVFRELFGRIYEQLDDGAVFIGKEESGNKND